MAKTDLIKNITFVTLENIVGLGKRQNDVLFSSVVNSSASQQLDQGPEGITSAHRHVVYFPGDVQNFHQVMLKNPGGYKWSCWSYENTCAILHRRFVNSYVWLIKPSRIHDGTFSCFDNFLHTDLFGAPSGFENFDGLLHLHNILLSAIDNINRCQTNAPTVPLVSKDAPLIMVGFSKGCVVLNQFLQELESAKTNTDLANFLKVISALYWLDAGHTSTSRVWITDEKLLQQLTDLKVKIRVHVSPRQVRDPGRPHIRAEERIFVDLLKSQGADVEETLHFPDEERSMEQHFRVLEEFYL